MTTEIAFVLLLAAGAAVLFVTERFSSDVVAMLVLALLLVTGTVSVSGGLAGFSSQATVSVAAMFVLSAGVERSGAMRHVADLLTRVERASVVPLALVLMATVGVLSAFVNNTAIVAILVPVVLKICRETGRSPSRLLMALSFSSMFGGVCTLIGTSTNLLASSLLEAEGLRPFGMFELSRIGLVLFGAGLAYMTLLGVQLIPNRRTEPTVTESYGVASYLTEVVLGEGAASVGKSLSDAPIAAETELEIVELRRAGVPVRPLEPDVVLERGDAVTLRGPIRKIDDLRRREGVAISTKAIGERELEGRDQSLIEAVVGPTSALVGHTVADVQARELQGGLVLALRHHRHLLRDQLAKQKLRPGDVLLLALDRKAIEPLRQKRRFVLFTEVARPSKPTKKTLLATGILIAVVALAAVGVVPIVVSATAGALAMVLLKCLDAEEAYQAIDFRVLVLLAGMLALGEAMQSSGAAILLAGGIIKAAGPFGPFALVSSLYLLTALLTELMSNNATVVLLTPIAIATAEHFGLDPRPLVIAVAVAASTSFMTPIGYQTNTMIYGPGQFRFADFARVGAPLNLIFWVLASLIIPLAYPLR